MTKKERINQIIKPHIPVMVNEVLHLFNLKKNGIYIDCTFGNGGHSKAILSSHNDIIVHAFDRDEHAKINAENLCLGFAKERLIFHHAKFSEMKEILKQCNINRVDGVLMDIGVSSEQLDNPQRGFSFSNDGPLDMSMGDNKFNAKTIVNNADYRTLSRIIEEYGEEQNAQKIAESIIASRKIHPIETTKQLAEIIHSALNRKKRGKIDSATLTFQALRIAVNNELEELDSGIRNACDILAPEGSLLVISFHALEDRIVKHHFRHFELATKKNDISSQDSIPIYQRLNKGKSFKPTQKEIQQNHRARSAKLRVLYRVR